ncbi:MAG: hypothetical protein M3Z09_17725, partial [Acidobacteriota bacterium]|nr:hypothetical protein [Acidobacteriota bacterium]
IAVEGQTIDLPDGTQGTAKFLNNYGHGPAQPADFSRAALSPPGLAYYTKGFTSLGGTVLQMRIIGTDPEAGAATTTIPATILPLRVVFSNGAVLDGANVVQAIQNSPIFQTSSYTVAGTDLGNTQYLDAMQRGEFWNFPGFSQTDYHLLLGNPTILPSQKITVPADKGVAVLNRNGVMVGLVDINFIGNAIDTLATSGLFSPGTLPMLVTDNVLEYQGVINNCCIVGYHSAEAGPNATAQTWVYAAYVRDLTFQGTGFDNTVALSHEVTEWANDPFVGDFAGLNVIPPAQLPGQPGSCIINFETGDPLEALSNGSFTKTTNGKTYSLQDSTTLWWYLHTSPSYAVNGFYSVQGALKQFSTLCGPG